MDRTGNIGTPQRESCNGQRNNRIEKQQKVLNGHGSTIFADTQRRSLKYSVLNPVISAAQK